MVVSTSPKSLVKQADLGSSPDGQFERSFAEMAYSVIQDRSPRLLDYLQGFQLIDRAEDRSKAVGVFGFLLGKQWLFIPCFFLAGGNLKGIELLWLKDQNTFVPNMEKWVNHLIGRRPKLLGRPSSTDAWSNGGRMPNLWRLTRAPYSAAKTARFDIAIDHVEPWAEPFLDMTKEALSRDVETNLQKKASAISEAADLSELLEQSPTVKQAAAWMGLKYPLIRAGLDQFYPGQIKWADFDQDKIENDLRRQAIVSHLNRKPKPRLTRKQAALQVWTRAEDLPYDASSKERSDILTQGFAVRDKRAAEDLSKLVNVHTELNISSPDKTGIYHVLCSDARFRKSLVLVAPTDNCGCKTRMAVVVPLEDKDTYRYDTGNMSDVFVAQDQNDLRGKESFEDWLDGHTSDSLTEGDLYVLVGPDGTGLSPFRVTAVLKDKHYKIDFTWESAPTKPRWMSHYNFDLSAYPNQSSDMSSYDVTLALDWDNVDKIRRMQSLILVPPGFKAVKIRSGDGYTLSLTGKSERRKSDDRSPIPLGSMADVRRVIEDMTTLFKVFNVNGGEYIVKAGGVEHRGTGQSCILHMVLQHGLPLSTARTLIKESSHPGERNNQYRIKYADGFGPGADNRLPPGIAPSFPPEWRGSEPAGPYRNYEAQYAQEEAVPVDYLSASRTDPNAYDPWRQMEHMQSAMQQAQQAQNRGDKDLFDVNMLKSLHRIVRQDDLLDKRIGKLMVAVNEYGTILYLFYWHGDKFADRFGRGDLQELESTLRNAFETSGDATLYLKEKSVNTGEGLPGFESGGEPSLDESA